MYGLGGGAEPYFFENWPLPLPGWVFFAGGAAVPGGIMWFRRVGGGGGAFRSLWIRCVGGLRWVGRVRWWGW